MKIQAMKAVSHILTATVVLACNGGAYAADNLLDPAAGGVITHYSSQLGSYPASRLNDQSTTAQWLSSSGQFTNDIIFRFGAAYPQRRFDGFRLSNHGGNRSIEDFLLLYADDSGLAADTGRDGWTRIPADTNPVDAINYLHWGEGGTLVSTTSQHGSYPASRLHDGTANNYWLSQSGIYGNLLTFAFDTDWNGATGDAISFEKFRLYNHGGSRSVQDFQVEYELGNSGSWQKLPAPGGPFAEFNYALEFEGGTVSTSSQHGSYPASRLNDGTANTYWLSQSGSYNNTLSFAFDTDQDGATGDAIIFDKLRLNNHNGSRSVQDFQLEYELGNSGSWQKLPAPGGPFAEFNYALEFEGGTVSASSQHGSYPASRLNDGTANTYWLSQSGSYNNTLSFAFDTDQDGATGDAITFDKLRLNNHSGTRSVQDFQVEYEQGNSGTWQKLPAPGGPFAEFNYALEFEGGTVSASSQLGSYPASRLNDGTSNTFWLSQSGVHNNILSFTFDTDQDGATGDAITFDKFRLNNYNGSRSVQDFEIWYRIGAGGWTKLADYTAVNSAATQEWTVGGIANVTGVQLRTVNNYGDSYTGIREIEIVGPNNGTTYTYTAAASSTDQVWTVAAVMGSAIANVTGVRLRTVNNYGDSYTGIREIEIVGPNSGTTYTYTAAASSADQVWSVAAVMGSAIANVTGVRLLTVNNYGDSYTGIREIEIVGPFNGPVYTYTAANTSTMQEWTVAAVNGGVPIADVTGFRLRTISNYGDSYTGLREIDVYGEPVGPAHLFSATAVSTTWQEFPFTAVSGRLLRVRIFDNHGDSYTGAREFELNASPLSPLAEWRMDEASWGQVQDVTGNGYHGAGINDATTAATDPVVSGSPGTCRYGVFDGSDDYVDLAGLPNLTDSFTITAWIKADDLGNDQRIFADDQTNNGGFALSLGDGGNGKLRFFSRSVNPIIVDTQNPVISAGTWHHVAAVHDVTAKTRTIYVDGVAVMLNTGGTSSVYTGTWGSDPGAASIGGENNAAGGEAVSRWRFKGSLDEVRVYTEALSQSQIQAVRDEIHPCVATGLDHIRLEHDGQGLTCMGETVTVSACADATCSNLYMGQVTLDFSSPAGGWNPDPVTFTGGTASVSLSHTTAGSVVLDATASSPVTASSVECINSSGGNACEMIFAETGILLDGDDGDGAPESAVPTQITGKPSQTGYGATTQRVRVVRTDNATGACVPGVGNQTLDAMFSYLLPVAGEGLNDDSLSVVAASSATLTAAGSGQMLQLAFDGNGTAPFSFTSQDAGRYQLRVEMAIPAVDPDGVPTGTTIAASDTSNGFVVRPLALYADATGNTRAQDADGNPFKSAGEPFTLGYKSLRWAPGRDNDNDGLWDSCASSTLTDPGLYARVPAWNIGQPGADLQQPAGGNPGSLVHGGGDAAFTVAATGVDKGGVSYSEVGIIQLQQNSLNPFLGEGVPLCSPYIGRFIPADFSFAITDHGALLNSCTGSGFSYAGTPIGYAAPQLPAAIITARNSSGVTTQNYTGAYNKLPLSGINMPNITSDGTQLGADGVTKVGLNWSIGMPGLIDNGNGTLDFGLSGDTFTYDRTANDRVAPFTSDLVLSVQSITDDDGVTAAGMPQSFTPAGVEVRYGRMAMQNAQGSELLPLHVPLQVEYYAGSANGFVANGADLCTAGLTAGLKSPVGQVVIAGGSRNTAIYAPAAVAGAYAADDLSDSSLLFVQPPVAGEFNLNLQPPGQGNTGSTDVEVVVPSWLKYIWSGSAMDNPSAKATFGVFSRPGGLIYQREAY